MVKKEVKKMSCQTISERNCEINVNNDRRIIEKRV